MNLESRIEKLEARIKDVGGGTAPMIMIRRLIDQTGAVTKCWLVTFPSPCDMAGFSAAMGAIPTEYRGRDGCPDADDCDSAHRCWADGGTRGKAKLENGLLP